MTAAATTELRVDAGGAWLAAHARGAGPAVLLVHGTAPAAWGTLPASLAATNRVVTYDRRTFGDSPAPAPPSLTVHASDAAAVIEASGAPATIVGWSLGGVIALEVAATRPDLVEALVLLEPPLHAKRHPRPRMVSAIAGAAVLGRLGRPDVGARRFLRWALGRRDGSDDLGRMPAAFGAALHAGDDVALVAELGLGTGEHLDRAALGRISVPTRVLCGDASGPAFAHAASRVVAAVPHATLVEVATCGHAVQLDAPGAVVDAVAAVHAD